jgi:serine phosphatase RsbU (regulator of sigma subunit)
MDSRSDSSPSTTPVSIGLLLQTALDAIAQLDSGIQRLEHSLEKRGFNFALDLGELSRTVWQNLVQAKYESENIVAQFEQLQHLVRSSARITSSLQLAQVLEQVVESVLLLTGAERACLLLYDDLGENLHRVDGSDVRLELLVMRAARNWNNESLETLLNESNPISSSVITVALEKREPVITTNALNDTRFSTSESILLQGLRSILCIPLLLDGNGRALGVLYADNRMQQGIFKTSMLPLLSAFGTQAGIAIEKARLHEEELLKERLEEELNVARNIQLSLLPKTCPTVPGWGFGAIYQAARVVGGDFYDFFELTPGQWGVVVADVADKGIPAAIFMGLSRTAIRSTALSGCTPAEALQRANYVIMQDSSTDMFLTAFYAVLDTASGAILFANAGHNRPLLYRADSGKVETLRARGVVLGLFDHHNAEDRSEVIAPGDVLLFYTDGMTEAMNENDEEFGEARLHNLLIEYAGYTADEISQRILESVRRFCGEAAQFDDMTMVVVKRDP